MADMTPKVAACARQPRPGTSWLHGIQFRPDMPGKMGWEGSWCSLWTSRCLCTTVPGSNTAYRGGRINQVTDGQRAIRAGHGRQAGSRCSAGTVCFTTPRPVFCASCTANGRVAVAGAGAAAHGQQSGNGIQTSGRRSATGAPRPTPSRSAGAIPAPPPERRYYRTFDDMKKAIAGFFRTCKWVLGRSILHKKKASLILQNR